MNALTSLDHVLKADRSSSLNALYFLLLILLITSLTSALAEYTDFIFYFRWQLSCQIRIFYWRNFSIFSSRQCFVLFCFCYCLVKATGFEIRFGPESWICHLATVQLWTTYFTFLSPIFSFIILKKPCSYLIIVRIKWVNDDKDLGQWPVHS